MAYMGAELFARYFAVPSSGAYIKRENSEFFQVPGPSYREKTRRRLAPCFARCLALSSPRAYAGGKVRNFSMSQSSRSILSNFPSYFFIFSSYFFIIIFRVFTASKKEKKEEKHVGSCSGIKSCERPATRLILAHNFRKFFKIPNP